MSVLGSEDVVRGLGAGGFLVGDCCTWRSREVIQAAVGRVRVTTWIGTIRALEPLENY